MTRQAFFEQFEVLADAPGWLVKLRALILEWAVRGRLVSQDDSEEPARQLLSRVAGISGGGKLRVLEQEITSGPFKIPANWEWVTLPACTKQADRWNAPFSSE